MEAHTLSGKKPRIESQDLKDAKNWEPFDPNASRWSKTEAEKWQKLYNQDVKPEGKEFQFDGQDYMIRPFFLPLFETIMHSVDNSKSVLIIGQPGIGKTVYLHYALVKLLHKEPDHPVLFIDGADAILFWKRTPYWMEATKCHLALPRGPEGSNYRLPIFVDLDFMGGGELAARIPISLLKNSNNHVVIQAASPQPSNFKWTKIAVPRKIGIPEWTVSELITGVEAWAKKGNYKDFHDKLQEALRGLTALPPVGSDNRSKALLVQMKEHNVSEAISRVVLWIDEAMERPRQAVDSDWGAGDNDEDINQEAFDYPLVPAEEVVKAKKMIHKALVGATELSQIPWDVIATILVLAAMKWFGPCPRDIYKYIRNPPQLEKEITQLFEFPGDLTNMRECIPLLKSALIGNSGNPPRMVHRVFFISVVDSQGTKPGKDTFVERPRWEFAFKSAKLEALAVDAVRKLHFNEIKHWYHIFEINPSSGPAGHFYELLYSCRFIPSLSVGLDSSDLFPFVYIYFLSVCFPIGYR